VRQVSEGPAARAAELAAQPAWVRAELDAFSGGINRYITEINGNPSVAPAEFVLLDDYPVKQWTADDTLAFGEYAGRFFGEFGHGEVAAAKTYLDMVAKLGQAGAEKAFADLYPLDDPRAPHTIPDSSGVFPRHTGTPVAGAAPASRYVNHDPALLPPSSDMNGASATLTAQAEAVTTLQRVLALPRWGSNAIVESGSRSDDGNPRLYGGPQTGWAVPGFFWEAELHDPQRDERGVAVPAIPLLVIGRNSDSAWTVTSGLDANSDLFLEQLDAADRTYVHDGQTLKVDRRTETFTCNNPPTAALDAISWLGGGASGPSPLCPVTPTTVTEYRTVHGPAVAGPDSTHHLYVRQSALDNRLVESLLAWDNAGRQHSAADFGAALEPMALCFNFFYVDGLGEIGYWHVGKLPIRPSNADPTLPMPGDGPYDWQGFEKFSDMPHAVNPRTGFMTNWNNKPARGWWSKSLDPSSTSVWGDEDQQTTLDAVLAAGGGQSFDRFGLFPRDVAYTDNRARVFLPYLTAALQGDPDPRLQAMLGYLRAWDLQRVAAGGGGGYGSPAVVFFDRFVQRFITQGLDPTVDHDNTLRLSGMDGCGGTGRCMQSVDNLAAPTLKFELNVEQTLLAALRGETSYDWFAAGGGATAVLRSAALAAADELTREQGADVRTWDEPVEQGAFASQGGGSVPNLVPLPDRGSYGQVAEPQVAAAGAVQAAASAGAAAPVGLVNTSAGSPSAPAAGALALLVLLGGGAVARRRRRATG
jgi:penicillin G amidase